MTEKVLAQGAFDIIHPGHIHYLKKSAKKGDKLTVVIARDSRIKQRKNLIFNEEERKEIIEALESVDKAVLGSEDDIYSTVEKINPDKITLGHDQHHSEEQVKQMAEEATGKEVEVITISNHEKYSSSNIKDQLQHSK
jgi:FAD synthetase